MKYFFAVISGFSIGLYSWFIFPQQPWVLLVIGITAFLASIDCAKATENDQNKIVKKLADLDYEILKLNSLLGNYLPIITKNLDISGVAYQIQKETYKLAEDGKKVKKIKEILI